MLSLRHFQLASWCYLSLGGWSPKTLARRISTCSGRLGGAAAAGRTMVMSPAAPDSFLVLFRFGADAGARAIGATDAAAANEPRGRRRRPPGSKAAQTGCRRRALSPTFPAGEPDQPPLLKLCLQRVRFQRTSTRQRLDCAKTQLLCSQENRRIPTFDGLSTCS